MVQYQPIGISLLITPWNYPGRDGDPQDRARRWRPAAP